MSWADLTSKNPMLIEVKRFQRRFFGSGKGATLNSVILVLSVICYIGLLLIVWNLREDIPPIALVIVQTGLFTLIAPSVLHGSIAGERERRSWDLLLVAPISKAQIIAGKFMGALAAVTLGCALFLIPIAIAAAFYRENWSVETRITGWGIYNLFLAELVSISFLFCVSAFSILISARSKRAFVALGVTLGFVFGALILLPAVLAMMFMRLGELIMYPHPFFVLGKILSARGEGSENYGTTPSFPDSLYGWPQIVLYVLMGILFLVWAERTLRFADSEARFVARSNNA